MDNLNLNNRADRAIYQRLWREKNRQRFLSWSRAHRVKCVNERRPWTQARRPGRFARELAVALRRSYLADAAELARLESDHAAWWGEAARKAAVAYRASVAAQRRRAIADKSERFRHFMSPGERAKRDAVRRVRGALRNRLRALMRGEQGVSKWKLVGCTSEQLRAHLESKFQPGMTWDNFGEWHVDHEVPLAVRHTLCPAINLTARLW